MTTTTDWKEEFDKRFGCFFEEGADGKGFGELDIKRFIKKILSQQKKDLLEKLPLRYMNIGKSGGFEETYIKGWNNCLDEVEKLLK